MWRDLRRTIPPPGPGAPLPTAKAPLLIEDLRRMMAALPEGCRAPGKPCYCCPGSRPPCDGEVTLGASYAPATSRGDWMSPLSTTKKYVFDRLARELAAVQAGMTKIQVQTELQAPHVELADDLVYYDAAGGVEDSVLLQACQTANPSAPLLALISVLLADERYSALLNDFITDADGIDVTHYNTVQVEALVPNYFHGVTSTRKVATNILGYLEQVGVVEAEKQGSTIVGVAGEPATMHHVPKVVELVAEWLEHKLGFGIPTDSRLDLVTGIGIHRWVNLSRDEFRRASLGAPQPVSTAARATLPAHLSIVRAELLRKRQMVLQGPPGTGKTYLAEQYIDWVTAGRADAARLTSIRSALPRHERDPARVIDHFLSTGAAAVWDIVQFHPSYAYEDFVRGLYAKPVAGGVTFEARNGVLGRLAAVAQELGRRGRSDIEVVLVIDEVNRADISKSARE